MFSAFGGIFSFLDYHHFVHISAPKNGQFFSAFAKRNIKKSMIS